MLLQRILDFPDRDVEHAMVPRARVGVLTQETSVAQTWALMSGGHTRYPVLGEHDEPLGVVHLADVLLADAADERPVTTLMRPALVVPTLMLLPDALDRLTATGNELACVIDEYGGLSGVLTMEDLAEELVGEISDEHDSAQDAAAAADGEDAWVMDGDLPIDEAERVIGRAMPRGDFETVAGMLIAHGGDLPALGQSIELELPHEAADLVGDDLRPRWLQIEVVEVERHVPSVLRVHLPPAGTPVPSDDQDAEARR